MNQTVTSYLGHTTERDDMSEPMWAGMRTIAKDIVDESYGSKVRWAGVEVKLEDGRLSIQGVIGMPSALAKGDADTCGQCVDAIAAIPAESLVDGFTKPDLDELVAIWKRWHLNDMRAGTPRQQQWLRENPVTAPYPESHYVKASEALASAGLNPDGDYKYGSAWLAEELPADVTAWAEKWIECCA